MPFIPLFAGLGAGAGEWFLFALLIYAAVAMMRRPGRARRWQAYQAEPVPRIVPPPTPHDPGDDPRAIRRSVPQASPPTYGARPLAYHATADAIHVRAAGLL